METPGNSSILKTNFQFKKMIKIHNNAVRSMALYSDVLGNQKLVTASRDGDAKIFPIVKLVIEFLYFLILFNIIVLSGDLIENPETVFNISCPLSSVAVMIPESLSTITNCPKVPVLFFGCLNGAIFVHLDNESIPLNVLTFHTQNGKVLSIICLYYFYF